VITSRYYGETPNSNTAVAEASADYKELFGAAKVGGKIEATKVNERIFA
jgi:hypothetical protein